MVSKKKNSIKKKNQRKGKSRVIILQGVDRVSQDGGQGEIKKVGKIKGKEGGKLSWLSETE